MYKVAALLELFGVTVLAAGIAIFIYLTVPVYQDTCHQSPQTQRIVCQPEPIRK